MRIMTINEIKKVQIDILDVVSSFCDDNSITYFLSYGTLLGAVRHKGYIPWDDDIDIVLPRKCYEKFIRSFNKIIDKEIYKVYTHLDTNWYHYPFAKVSYEKTCFKEENVEIYQDLGVNIDLFPIDVMPEGKKEQRKLMNEIKWKKRKIYIKYSSLKREKNLFRKIIKYFLKIYYNKIENEKIIEDIINTATKYSNHNSGMAGVIVWGYEEGQIVAKNLFDKIILMEFEGKKYKIPKGYKEWLTSIYGDYMTLPPIDKQVSHHDFKAYWKDTENII